MRIALVLFVLTVGLSAQTPPPKGWGDVAAFFRAGVEQHGIQGASRTSAKGRWASASSSRRTRGSI